MTTTGLLETVTDAEGMVAKYGSRIGDHYNRMIGGTLRAADGTVIVDVQYDYDVFGNRIEKRDDTNGDGIWDTKLRTAYDGNMPWADVNTSNALVTRYVIGDVIDQIFARVSSSGTVDWYLTDHLGSVRFIVDNTGATIAELEYDPYGNLVSTPDPDADRFQFTGRELDEELGLYYYRARMYDSSSGRFLTEDPISFSAGDSNLRRYVGNSTLLVIDPTGLAGQPGLKMKDTKWGRKLADANMPDRVPDSWDCDQIIDEIYNAQESLNSRVKDLQAHPKPDGSHHNRLGEEMQWLSKLQKRGNDMGCFGPPEPEGAGPEPVPGPAPETWPVFPVIFPRPVPVLPSPAPGPLPQPIYKPSPKPIFRPAFPGFNLFFDSLIPLHLPGAGGTPYV